MHHIESINISLMETATPQQLHVLPATLQAAGKVAASPEAAKPKAIEFVFQLLLFGFAALDVGIHL